MKYTLHNPHHEHTFGHWQQAVDNADTDLGYHAWVVSMLPAQPRWTPEHPHPIFRFPRWQYHCEQELTNLDYTDWVEHCLEGMRRELAQYEDVLALQETPCPDLVEHVTQLRHQLGLGPALPADEEPDLYGPEHYQTSQNQDDGNENT